jgi:hypothetical protein
MMRRETRLALTLLVEKAHRMRDGRYVGWLREQGGTSLKYSLKRNPEDGSGSVTIEHDHPDEDVTDSLILKFRFFIQENDTPSFQWLTKNVMDDDGLSDEWKQDFTRVRDELNEFLDSQSGYDERVIAPATPGTSEEGPIVGEYQWTHRQIMDKFIYGSMAHAKPKKREIYMRWKSNEMGFPFIANMFDHIIMTGLRAIAIVGDITEREFANQGE